ncbi:CocE/NonD family hydrolase C-terminal non-catalytic domain-containing protein [Micromonospora sp. NPDC048930]|uniref:S15 peptidase family protein n=1 Tax=Micromonospora sp. NPDC048930 TaxID=3364261 RepID=UPI00371A5A4E
MTGTRTRWGGPALGGVLVTLAVLSATPHPVAAAGSGPADGGSPDAGALSANCAGYPGGATICSAQVPSFDGAPLDVDITRPLPGTGDTHPLIVLLHGFGNDKHEWESTSDAADGADKYHWNSHWFAAHGYYVLTYTARGFRDNGPRASYQPATPAGVAPTCLPPGGSACPPAGTIRVKNKDVEIRDTQWLAALTALAYPDIDRDQVAVSGGSYGGGESWLQAAAQAGSEYWSEWPGLPRLRLQVAVPKYPWTDLAYALMPNGHPGGPSQAPAGEPYRGSDLYSSAQGAPDTLGVGNPIGVAKSSYVGGLYSLGTANGAFDEGSPSPQSNGPEPFTAWLGRVDAGEPYSAAGRVDDPTMAQVRTAFSGWHSAYYQPGWRTGRDAGRTPAILSVSGWTDDLFPPVESFRMFTYLKSLDRDWPVAVVVGDIGHARAQNPPGVWQAINEQAWRFLQANITGSRPARTTVSSYPTRCGDAATAADEISASSPAALAKGTLVIDYNGSVLLPPTSGATDADAAATDAVAGGAITSTSGGCRRSARLVTSPSDGYTAISQPLPAEQTLVGIGRAEARCAATPGATTAVLAARVWDVSPDGAVLLVSRGVYRFDFTSYDARTGIVQVPLYGNHWTFPAGHRIRLDLAQVDQPTYRPPNTAVTATLDLSATRLVLPVRQQATTTIR